MEKNSIEMSRINSFCPENRILKADPLPVGNNRHASETEIMPKNNRLFKRALSQELLGIGLSKKAVKRILTIKQVE